MDVMAVSIERNHYHPAILEESHCGLLYICVRVCASVRVWTRVDVCGRVCAYIWMCGCGWVYFMCACVCVRVGTFVHA